MHPDGGSSLLFQLQGCLSVDAQPARQGVVFNAAAAKSGALVLEPGVQVFAVRFCPGMGSVFWRAAASDFANELMGLDCAQYLRFDLPAVTEQLQMAADMLARVLCWRLRWARRWQPVMARPVIWRRRWSCCA
ncbi:hypothetical protein ULF88_06110 [Halopseudomonas pachastrellae]|nr:hypothetical protein [Halopseudomonas pachastrellae]